MADKYFNPPHASCLYKFDWLILRVDDLRYVDAENLCVFCKRMGIVSDIGVHPQAPQPAPPQLGMIFHVFCI